MKQNIINFDNKNVGDIELTPDIFGLEARPDILQRVVAWQLAKRRAGTHAVKTMSDVSGGGRKPRPQKGSGNARLGSTRVPQARKGGVSHGPVVRSHAIKLQKKVRQLGLKMALSAKLKDQKLVILDSDKIKENKTKTLAQKVKALGWTSALIIGGKTLDEGFVKATRNIKKFDSLPSVGANVYDILRHDTLVLTKEAVKDLEARLNG